VADSTIFESPTTFGVYLMANTNSKQVSFQRCAFSGIPTGAHYIWAAGTGANTTLNVDHCDFASTVIDAPAITASDLTTAQITVSNCNIGTTPELWSYTVGGSPFSATYHHCNLYGAAISADWTDGGSNVSPVAPSYANLPKDWRYPNPALLTADSAGGPLGSMIHWLAGPDVPNAAKNWTVY
jgi:hypothetical protein